MYKITIHGKWAEDTAKVLTNSALKSGKFAKFSLDEDTAYCRVAHKEVNESGMICNPDCVIVLDGDVKPQHNVLSIINSKEQIEDSVCIDATEISKKVKRQSGAGSALLGAFTALSPLITFRDLMFGIEKTFTDQQKQNRNMVAAKEGFEAVKK